MCISMNLPAQQPFALIEKDKRIWGIDFDNIRGWHLHPLRDFKTHYMIAEKSIEDIINELEKVWLLLIS